MIFRIYSVRLIFRILVFLTTLRLYLKTPESLAMDGFSFSNGLQPLVVLWIILAVEMILKLIPQNIASIGCQKQFKFAYAPNVMKPAKSEMDAWFANENNGAKKVAALWIGGNALVAIAFYLKILGVNELLLLTLCYYVGDLFCLLIKCPFQSIMKNRCCVTCRIFNWDCLMMVTPLMFVPTLFSWSLVLMGLIVFVHWEYALHKYPQRFYEGSNTNLSCRNCTESICRLKKAPAARPGAYGEKWWNY